jgi:cobyrinic acid a,c-diamide synthase
MGFEGTSIKKAVPRVIIASPQGHTGKTVVSLGLCAALKARHLIVQPFKRGPDYIDPSWLTAASGRNCRNLDPIMMSEKEILVSFTRASQDADITIIEGAMGLFDGFDDEGRGSTAQISRIIDSPVILVINASRMTRSAAALVSGFQHFEADVKIAGVILNNVAGTRHENKLRDAIKNYCGIPVVGSLPRESTLNINERHLGLVPYPEIKAKDTINRIQQVAETNLDIDLIQKIASEANEINSISLPSVIDKPKQVKIGVISDQVFNFYYPENLEALKREGAEIVLINSIRDAKLPEIDALYIGGGFPELFLPELEANVSLRQNIKNAIENYLPVYAECAGLMYLCESIKWKDNQYKMVGSILASIEVAAKPQGHGYINVEASEDNPYFPPGMKIWGHEFHHSKIIGPFNFKTGYKVLRGQGLDGQVDGIVYKNLLASYMHIHSIGAPIWARNLVSCAIRENRKKMNSQNAVSK